MVGRLRDALIGPGRRRSWRRRVLRRAVAGICAGTAVLATLGAVRAPADGPTVAVLVASKRIAVGEVPSRSTVRVVSWPVRLVPSDALHSLALVQGRRASTVISPGEPVTEPHLSTSALLAGQPPGTVAVHVTLADPGASAMVGAGDRVDLVGPAGTVARGVLVLHTDDSLDPTPGLVPGARSGASQDGPTGIVVAAGHEDAQAIARTPADAMGRPALTLVLRSG